MNISCSLSVSLISLSYLTHNNCFLLISLRHHYNFYINK